MSEHRLPPITRRQIARYAAAINDFNRIHVDVGFARTVGLPDVVAHGPLTLSLVLDDILATGRHENLSGFGGRLRAPVLPGDVLRWREVGEGIEVLNDTDAIVASLTLEYEENPQ